MNTLARNPAPLRSLSLLIAIAVTILPAPGDCADGNPEDPIIFERGDGFGFRIPALITAANGDILAFCERRVGLADHAQNDIVLRRSPDSGKTWGELQIIEDAGGDSLNDPSAIVLNSGEIALIYQRFPKGFHSVKNAHHEMAEPGYGGPRNTRTLIRRSKDHGATWSDAEDISRVARREGAINVASPGRGIQLKHGKNAGRLLFPIYENHATKERRIWKTSVLISDDNGKTWRTGETVPPDEKRGAGNENQIVELKDGSILMSSRNQSGEPYRRLTVSHDAGETWEPYRLAEDLVTTQCMASVIRHGDLLVHSLPNSKKGRVNGTILVSRDEGKTWKPVHIITKGGFAYSSLTELADGTVACLYEADGYKSIRFARIPESAFAPQADPQANAGKPNILLIVGEDHGVELSCYGDPVIQTPNIDRLAADGILFENGYVTQSVCSPSRSTIFTGLYPHQNGQLGLATHGYAFFKRWPTSYSLLKAAGYRTGLIGKTHINPKGAVEDFVDFRYQPSANFVKKNVASYAVESGKFFRESEAPFFMTVNYPDAHWPLQDGVGGLPTNRADPKKVKVMPYVGHETPRLKGIAENYYNCMLRLDECVGQLLAELDDSGKTDNTLVIFIGDHGAQMARGKVTVYEGGMRVPYIARWPGVIKAEQRSKALVSTIDLLPTFLDVAAIKTGPDNLPGKSLRPLFSGNQAEAEFRKFLVCERNCDAAHYTFPQRTIRNARYKLIHTLVHGRQDNAAEIYQTNAISHWAGSLNNEELTKAPKHVRDAYARWLNPPEFQLFDLSEDPHEWHDRSEESDYSAIKKELIAELKNWQKATSDPLAYPEKLRLLMEENDAVYKSKNRSPKGGWQYLKYLHPDS